jgi:beta-lactamase class A
VCLALCCAPVAATAAAVPSTPAGRQLGWLLSIAKLPLPAAEIEGHFDAAFLAKAPPAELNSVFASLAQSGLPTLVGLPRAAPSSLSAVIAFGQTSYDVVLTVDGSGLISGLLFTPHAVPAPTSWRALDAQLGAIAPGTGFLAARVGAGGTCTAVHAVNASTPRPLGSMFKLFVLGALANAVHEHKIAWGQLVTVTAAVKTGGSGTLQNVPDGTKVTVEQAALKMISISDNTAADLLLNLVGRSAVEAQVHAWVSQPRLDIPFLTVKELFALHYDDFPALAKRYLSLGPAARAAFLSSTVDRVRPGAETAVAAPRDIDSIEWLASPDDICRAFSGLAALQAEPGLQPLGTVLSTNNGGIGLSATAWPTIWFKGGSEPGVLTLAFLARDSAGRTDVVVALTENPAKPLGPTAVNDLLAVVRGALGLLR